MSTFAPSEEQKKAIDCCDSMVVIARPGSGKTTVVTRKVRDRLSELCRHQGIVAISFTNKASDELERRCKANAFDVKQSFFGTIDEFCLREIIYPFARQVMPVASDAKTAKLHELPEAASKLLPPTLFHAATVADTAAFLPYLQAALSHGWIPLEAVGMLACHVFDHSAACKRYFAARYKAVFIDEYQDTGYFQHELFLRLRALGLTAVAVGDDDQSIYGFAHKDSRYLVALTAQGSGFTSFAITTNFRSHPSINEFALRLLNPSHTVSLTNDTRMFIKTIQGHQSAMGTWLGTAIPHLMGHFQVATPDRVAILCRHQHSACLIGESLGLAHHVFEENPFKTAPSAEVKLLSDLLRLRYDQQSTVETLLERAGAPNRLHLLARRALRRLVLRCRTCTVGDLVASLKEATAGLLGKPLSGLGEAELQAVCADAALLQRFRSPARDAVQIMTLHKAKGLEFDLVFHADLYDHVIPKRIYTPGSYEVVFEDFQQCLNLHYVGVTRAVKACVLLTSSSRINGGGEAKKGAPSQLIGRNGTSAVPIPW